MDNTINSSSMSELARANQAAGAERRVRVPESAPQVAASRVAPADRSVASAAVVPAREPSDKEVATALEEVKRIVETRAPNELLFSIDKDSGRSVVRIVDQQTGEVIRQIPPQELIEISKSLEKMQGLLLRQQA